MSANRSISAEKGTHLSALLRIDWPPDHELRVRKIISRSRAIPTGKHWSSTLDRNVHWESDVECDGQTLADACPGVSSYREQPCKIVFLGGDETYVHIPDLHIDGALPRPLLIEFKSDNDPKLGDAVSRARTLTPVLREAGYDYHVVLGSALRRSNYLRNARLITRFARRPPSELDIATGARRFRGKSRMTGADYLNGRTSEVRALQSMYRLIFGGYITVPMHERLTDQTTLTWHGCPAREEGIQWLQAAFALIRS